MRLQNRKIITLDTTKPKQICLRVATPFIKMCLTLGMTNYRTIRIFILINGCKYNLQQKYSKIIAKYRKIWLRIYLYSLDFCLLYKYVFFFISLF